MFLVCFFDVYHHTTKGVYFDYGCSHLLCILLQMFTLFIIYDDSMELYSEDGAGF